jgi:Raf kinase inhibitor-like YbhB/YbcL family protein
MLWPVRYYLCIAAVTLPLAATWEGRMGLSLTSTAFTEGGPIPVKHTCDGADLSPPLVWSGVPQGTAALALVADDPDAPARTWVHWVLYDVPAAFTGLPENVSKVAAPKELDGAVQGRNDSHALGYGGPCPPPGPAHRYFFKLYALAAPLGLKPGASKQEVERAMGGHVLATAQLMGRYARQGR